MQGFSKAPVELDEVKHEPIWPYGRAWLTIVNAVQAAVMVAIAQLVEHRVVVAGVAGSSPVSHPSQSLGTEVPRLFSSHRNSSCAPACRQACKYGVIGRNVCLAPACLVGLESFPSSLNADAFFG